MRNTYRGFCGFWGYRTARFSGFFEESGYFAAQVIIVSTIFIIVAELLKLLFCQGFTRRAALDLRNKCVTRRVTVIAVIGRYWGSRTVDQSRVVKGLNRIQKHGARRGRHAE